MNIFGVNLDTDVAIVAEIGVNHEGNVERAKQLVIAAARTGADAVKFQAYNPNRLWAANERERLARAYRFNLGYDALVDIGVTAKIQGIPMFCSAATETVVPWLKEFFPAAIKIASGDVDFDPVLKLAAESGCPMIVSTGFGSAPEIGHMVGFVAKCMNVKVEAGRRNAGIRNRLIIMHAVPTYPTEAAFAEVWKVRQLMVYGPTVGYSNHVPPKKGGTEACLAAVTLGARVIEVHFTDGKEPQECPDHALSFNAEQLGALVEAVAHTSLALRINDRQKYTPKAMIRKGVVAARPLPVGTVLTEQDMVFARPALEFSWSDATKLIGRKVRKELEFGETISRLSLEE